jgi:catechol 2,3-dioxygenase
MPPFEALPPGSRPGPVRLQVADLGRALAWYVQVLGMQELRAGNGKAALGATQASDAGVAGAGPGSEVEATGALVELVERPGAASVPRHGRPGLYHFALLLPDRASLGRFLGHASALRIPLGAADHGVSEALYLSDPDGHGIEVYADRPASAWTRTPAGELVMTTDPLDTEALLRERDGGSWEGLPEGTSMGHLHLHVGDLARAEAFYVDALGLGVTVRSYPGALFLAAGGYHHHLGLNTWARDPVPPRPDDARLLQWELTIPTAADLDAALVRMEAAGHAVERTDRGGVVADPWGTRLLVRIP